MIGTPIDTEGTRFRVITIEGYPIVTGGRTAGTARPVLAATVIDAFYGTEHGRFASNDRYIGGVWTSPKGWQGTGGRARGHEGALAAAADRCAELNAWHEREGWGEDVPLAS